MIIAALSIAAYMIFQTDTSVLGRWLESYRSTIHAEQLYRPPNDKEVERFLADFEKAFAGETDFTHLGELGYSAKQGYDELSGKSYILLEKEADSERAWGAYLIETSRTPKHVIAAAHPRSDIGSEKLALTLWRETPGALYMIAGSHRRAVEKYGDVTRHTDSLFHKVTEYLLRQDLTHLQLHGYANVSSPDEDIIVSSGSADKKTIHQAVVDELRRTNLPVGTNWEGKNDPLRGRINQQGKAAKQLDGTFLHIEMSRETRENAQLAEQAITAIAKGLSN